MVVKELVALLGIKTDKKGFDQAESGMGRVIKIAKAAAAAFAALKIVQFAKGVVEETAAAGDAIDKLSKRSGIGAIALQEWGHAAELSGASMGDVEMTIKRLQAAQVEAADGVATYADEFKRLGVDVKDTDGNFKETTDLLLEMSDAVNGLESQAEKTNVAMKLMGRSGTTLLPMLASGSEGIREMLEEMKALGGVMDEDLIKASADYIDNQRRMEVAMIGVKNFIAKELLPAINSLTTGFIDWWKANGLIIRQQMGIVFGRIGRVILANVRFFGRLVKIVFDFVANLSPLQKRILGIGAAVTALGALILAGPIGKIILLISLIGLLIEDFEVWRKGGKSVIGDLFKALGELFGIDLSFEAVAESFARVFDFMTGIIGGFGAAVFETIFALVDFLINVWDDPGRAFQKFTDMLSGIWGDFGEEIKAAFELFWIDIGGFFNNFWTGLIEGLASMKNAIVAWASETIDAITAPFREVGEFFGLLDKKAPTGKPSPAGAGVRRLVDATTSASRLAGTRVTASGSGGSSIVNAPNTNITVDVHASPGMDEKRLGQEVSKQINQHTARQNRAAMRVFTRAPSGTS